MRQHFRGCTRYEEGVFPFLLHVSTTHLRPLALGRHNKARGALSRFVAPRFGERGHRYFPHKEGTRVLYRVGGSHHLSRKQTHYRSGRVSFLRPIYGHIRFNGSHHRSYSRLVVLMLSYGVFRNVLSHFSREDGTLRVLLPNGLRGDTFHVVCGFFRHVFFNVHDFHGVPYHVSRATRFHFPQRSVRVTFGPLHNSCILQRLVSVRGTTRVVGTSRTTRLFHSHRSVYTFPYAKRVRGHLVGSHVLLAMRVLKVRRIFHRFGNVFIRGRHARGYRFHFCVL